MRIGTIGAGRWAEAHRRALEEAGATVAAVLVATDASAERVEAEWGAWAGTELSAFLAREPDAVVVCGPNHLHAEHAAACLRAGRHVLVEKPLALRTDQAEALVALAEAHDRVLAVGHQMRAYAWAETAHRLLHDGTLGAPRHLAVRLWRRPHRAGAGGWKADPARRGSPVLEEPIHYLDLIRWWAGDPIAVQAFATDRPGREGEHQNLEVRLEFPGGAQAWAGRSIAAWGHRVDVTLVGDEGSFRAVWEGDRDDDPAPRSVAFVHRGEDRDAPAERVALRAASGHAFDLVAHDRAFLEACVARDQGDRSVAPLATGADGAAAVRLCLTVERSLAQGGVRVVP